VSAVLILAVSGPAEALIIDWVRVGAPGNAADDTGYGAVAYDYLIGRYEVTNAQYAAFLNAVAASDTHSLYNTSMGSPYGGITQDCSSGPCTYSTRAGRADMPVNYVSFYDALRFANWLHNGQPTGAQDSTTTEDGAYDMSLGNSVVRKAGARFFLTSEDEWYKAAYYDAGSASYYDYPAGSDTETWCTVPGSSPNTANCANYVADVTNGGSYTGSASPSGTFDQGGNVFEWNEALVSGSFRCLRGGSFWDDKYDLGAAYRSAVNPGTETWDYGFRIASLPCPFVPSLSPMGAALLGGLVFAIALGGLAVQRRRRAG
jgi:formylglycine-generating enzyme required for sulfatase activity